MGRSYTPKYVIDMRCQAMGATPAEWRVKAGNGNLRGYGLPNAKNLEKYVEKYNESLKKGGANEHIGMKGMCIWAGIRENYQGAPYLAEWKAPMFQAIEPSEYLK